MPFVLEIDFASAGAMTSANRIGVNSGTRISRGVCALSAKRRRDNVAKAPKADTAVDGLWLRERTTVGTVVVTAVIVLSPSFEVSRTSRGETDASELEVDVVERRCPRREGRHRDTGGGHGVDRAARRL